MVLKDIETQLMIKQIIKMKRALLRYEGKQYNISEFKTKFYEFYTTVNVTGDPIYVGLKMRMSPRNPFSRYTWVFQDDLWVNGVTPEFATMIKTDMGQIYRNLQKELSFHSSYIKRLDSKCTDVNLAKVQRLITNWLSYK